MSARARVLSAVGVESLRNLLREANTLPADAAPLRQAGTLYAGALAAAKLKDLPAAERLAGRLPPLVANDPAAARAARLLQGELALMAGQPERAARMAAGGSGRSELLLGAQAALAAGRASEAAQALQTWVTQHGNDGTAWQLLAHANTVQGQTLRAVRAEAEAQLAWMDYPAALDRLRAAQDIVRRGGVDYIEASIIDTRARQVESLVREQALER